MQQDTFVKDATLQVAALIGTPTAGVGLGALQQAIHDQLRAAEAATGGKLRDLWGHAAANVGAAQWIGADAETSRELWATVLDYVTSAVELQAAVTV